VLLTATIVVLGVFIQSSYINVNKEGFWVWPFVFTIVTYILFGGLVIKLPKLSLEHSTNQQSVWMGGIDMSGYTTTYTFTNWRYAKLFAMANQTSLFESERRNRAKSTAFIKAVDHPIRVLFLTLIITGALLFVNSLLTSTNAPSISNSTAGPSTSSGSLDTQTKQQKFDAMKEDLESRSGEIKSMEIQLKNLQSDLELYENMYKSSKSNVDADLYNNTLDEYKRLYDDYDNAINEYNKIVKEYNELADS
jgi:hypothetical protein